MLMAILEIIAFMAVAVVLGLVLGWVLRGMFGNEQAEITDVRAQLRKLKKAQREQEAAAKDVVVKASTAKEERATSKVVTSTVTKTEGKAPSKPLKPEEEKSEAHAVKPKAKKKVTAAKADAKSKKKASSPRKSIAEREADQAAARQAFAGVTSRIGKSDVQDKLTKIYGIGKRYAEMLNELGLDSYEQVSKLRKADLKILSGALGVLDDRIETEDWVGSAKKLAKEAKK